MSVFYLIRIVDWKRRYRNHMVGRLRLGSDKTDEMFLKDIVEVGWESALELGKGDVKSALELDPVVVADEEISYWTY